MSYRSAVAASIVQRVTVTIALVLGALVMLTPLYIMLVMAMKSPGEIQRTSAWAWPVALSSGSFSLADALANFKSVLTNPSVSFGLFFRNTALISTLSTAGVLISSAVVAYAFARIRFRGRDRLFVLLLSTMMLPGIVTMIPTYILYKYLHWVNTFNPLIVPSFFGSAFFIFLLRQFFMGIPRELDEAAVLDGAGHWTIFSRVILPLSGPALVTVALFAFISSWRDFMGPLLYLNDPEKQTLEVGLRTYQTLQSEQWHLLMAASVLVMLPLIVLFFVGQRYFVKGIVMSGLK